MIHDNPWVSFSTGTSRLKKIHAWPNSGGLKIRVGNIFSKNIVLCLGASSIFTLLKNKEMLSPSANFDRQIVSNNNLYDLVETPLIDSIY